jgi:hypothetical protein
MCPPNDDAGDSQEETGELQRAHCRDDGDSVSTCAFAREDPKEGIEQAKRSAADTTTAVLQ